MEIVICQQEDVVVVYIELFMIKIETVSPNKYILDNYGFGFDYVKNWNCQIKNSDDTPYKTDKCILNNI